MSVRGLGALGGALLLMTSGVAIASARDFEHPASHDTAQQFAPGSVQRQDTPTDSEYDAAEPDSLNGHTSTSLRDERFDLFGFPSALTGTSARYEDTGHGHRPGDPQVSGFNAAGAWKLERGRYDADIAILDTGVKWDKCELRDQLHLDTAELPLPRNADGAPDAQAPLGGYDLNRDGAVDVDDWAADRRVGRAFTTCGGRITGEDLIRAFSDGVDADHNGFVDDIVGWDFFDNDNDPTDASSYFSAKNHGSGRASDAAEQGDDGSGGLGVCPRCQFVPLRVWDTFVSDGNTFGLAMMYAADNGSRVIEGADGSMYHSAFAEAASQYAYERGAVQTFSGDDLNTGDHNYPANYDHVMEIQGTVPDTDGLDAGGSAPPPPSGVDEIGLRDGLCNAQPLICHGTNGPVHTYFRGANTTQYGGHSSVAMEGATGSANTGKASGAAALVISAGLNRGIDLLPDETREILEQTAEDVTAANTAGVGSPDFAQAGWDPHFGWGRVDLGAAVGAVADGRIPPQAAISSPDWFAPLAGTSVRIKGVARARWAVGGRFHYRLEWGPGLAPTTWTTISTGDARGTKVTFGHVDLDAVRRALAAYVVPVDLGGPVFAPGATNPYQSQFAVRLTVTDPSHPDALPGVDRKVLTAVPDGQDLRSGFPKRLGTGGEAPLRYADLDGDNHQELIVPTEDGLVHAYEPDGQELRGWPVRTLVQSAVSGHESAPGFRSGIALPREPPRGPTIADLDGDGRPEVITAAGRHVYVWEPDGRPRPGFPVASNPDFCRPQDESQPLHHPKCGFASTPAVARLGGTDKPYDIVAPSLDGHLYALTSQGIPTPGFPIALVDPAQPIDKRMVAESINNPAIGDLNGDGHDDIVIAGNETYGPAQPATLDLAQAFSDVLASAAGGSSRLYAVDGATGAFLPGWPVHLNGAIQNVLPFVGPGHDAALATIDDRQVIIASTTGGALAEYGVDGTEIRAAQQNAFGPLSNVTDRNGMIGLFESATIGDVMGTGRLALVKYGLTLGQVANLLATGQNVPYNHTIGAYDAGTGAPLPAWPTITDDYQLLSSSTIAKVDPSRSGNQVLAGTGLGLVHAYDGVTGMDAPGFPKVTGGWLFAPVALSDDGRMAAITREGYLFEWSSNAPACQPEWPSFRHDAQGSGNYDHDGSAPGAPADVEVSDGRLTFTAPGDDGGCGTATRYQAVTSPSPITAANFADARPIAVPAPAPAGTSQSIELPADAERHLSIRAVDDAGNVGPPQEPNHG